jgi:serine-type D-Ala-D-Ala carboxypeptidase/endopeptidase
MKNYCLLFLQCSLFLTRLAIGQDKQADIKIDSLVQRLGEKFMKSPQAVGLSIGICNNGKSSYYNFGTTTKDKNDLPSENTIYEIGSITKTFCSYLLAKAVVEKKVILTDDIRKYIDGDYPNLEFSGHSIQLIHLSNTTSGIPEWVPAEPDVIKKAPSDSVTFLRAAIFGNYTRKDFFNGLHQIKLDTIPGFKTKHSNGAAQLLAYILENVYKKPFEKLVQQYILKPNQMNRSFFSVPDSEKKCQANGYDDKGRLAPDEFRKPYFRSMGGLQSCTKDLLPYIKLQLHKENEIVSLNHKRTIDINAQTGNAAGLLPDSLINAGVYSIALNWLRYEPGKNNVQYWTDGGTTGFNSYLIFYPEHNSGIVILANKSDEKTFRALPGIAYEIFNAMGKK